MPCNKAVSEYIAYRWRMMNDDMMYDVACFADHDRSYKANFGICHCVEFGCHLFQHLDALMTMTKHRSSKL